MANDGTKTQTQTHVPAWKRLGLKLKYVSEDVGENATATATATTAAAAAAAVPADSIEETKGTDADKKKDKKKRKKNESEDGDGSHAAAATGTEETGNNKKRRLENGVAAGVSPGEGKHDQKQKLQEDNAAATPQRKSVSFTPDTKDGEGDGKTQTQSGDKEQQNGDEEEMDEEERKKEEIRQKKREKKRKKRQEAKARQQAAQSNNSNAATSVDDSPILSYLTHFYEDRSSWKFQKNRESHLLKHALSLERVPKRFNTPLLVYLQGLRSEGARQRLREAAEEVISTDGDQWTLGVTNIENDGDGNGESEQNDSSLPASGTSGEKYREAVEAFRAKLTAGDKDLENGSTLEGADADTQKRLERRQRAELILWAINGKLGSSSSPIETKATSPKVETSSAKADGKNVGNNNDNNKKNTPTTAPKKKRKNRTAVVEISSSSSESDSDSDD